MGKKRFSVLNLESGLHDGLHLFVCKKKKFLTTCMVERNLRVTGKVVIMWSGGHGFKLWKRPLVKMQDNTVCNGSLWLNPFPDPTHNGRSFSALDRPFYMLHGSLKLQNSSKEK